MRTHQEEKGAWKQSVSFGNFTKSTFAKIADHSKSPFVETIFAKSAIVLVANSKSPLAKSCEHQPHGDWDAE